MKHRYFSISDFKMKQLAKRQTEINRQIRGSFYIQKVKDCRDFSDTEKKIIIENYNRLNIR